MLVEVPHRKSRSTYRTRPEQNLPPNTVLSNQQEQPRSNHNKSTVIFTSPSSPPFPPNIPDSYSYTPAHTLHTTSHHNAKSITHAPHQPIRPPRKRQRNLCAIQHKQQLRQRRLHVLRVAVIEVRVDVAETAGIVSKGSMIIRPSPSQRIPHLKEMD